MVLIDLVKGVPMPPRVDTRYNTYRHLMQDRHHWQKTLGIISCKTLRKDYPSGYTDVIRLLISKEFRSLVADRDLQLAFTGGTFESLRGTLDSYPEFKGRLFGLAPSALGVIQIANLVVYGHLFAVMFFNHMEDLYADSPQNLCLRRICNHCETPLFEDFSSISFIVRGWCRGEQEPRTRLGSFPSKDIASYYGSGRARDNVMYRERLDGERLRQAETLAIVSHNERKMTMLTFCLENMHKILRYRRVISTGTTGKKLATEYLTALEVFGEAIKQSDLESWGWNPESESAREFIARKICPMKSGPEGGDIQISAKVIDGTCHRVLFFQDPQTAHPHQFDIRLMEKAIQDPMTAALFATSEKTARIIV